MIRKGRFSKPAAEIAQRYGESVSFDWRLYRHDIAGSIAHTAAPACAGITSGDELQKIETELRAIEKEIASGKFEWDPSLEDLHMNVELALTKRVGAAGAKLHAARSRNDQIALDLRLYGKAEIAEVLSRLKDLQKALLDLAEKYVEVVAATDPNLLATDLAEYLVKKGTPFREAHEIVGNIVTRCAANKVSLNQVPLAELKNFSPVFESDIAEIFDVDSALAKRQATGAPSPDNIGAQIQRWRSDLGLTNESG